MAIFNNMDDTENKFLQKVNLDSLQKETGMDLKELASLAGIGPKVIYKWAYMHKDSSRPDYNAVVRLLQKGATMKTLFGVEPKVGNAEFREGMANANDPEFNAKVERVVLEMKSKGQL